MEETHAEVENGAFLRPERVFKSQRKENGIIETERYVPCTKHGSESRAISAELWKGQTISSIPMAAARGIKRHGTEGSVRSSSMLIIFGFSRETDQRIHYKMAVRLIQLSDRAQIGCSLLQFVAPALTCLIPIQITVTTSIIEISYRMEGGFQNSHSGAFDPHDYPCHRGAQEPQTAFGCIDTLQEMRKPLGMQEKSR